MKTIRETVTILFQGHAIELPKLRVNRSHIPKPIQDGLAYYQALMDEEWERWEKNATLAWEREIL